MKKKTILFIGHIYHKKTKSMDFLIDILSEKYDVEKTYIDPYIPNPEQEIIDLKGKEFDIVICWQFVPSKKSLKGILYQQLVFFPMFDMSPGLNLEKWLSFRNMKIISFSKAIYEQLSGWGFDVSYFQFFIKPLVVENFGNSKSCFFWQRTNHISCQTALKTIGDYITHLHVHQAVDPEFKKEELPVKEGLKITSSSWFESKEDLLNKMNESAIYFAPRLKEGIGMSFLEAMAMGRCVVAPDSPTMNEYIEHGKNGFLYNPNAPEEIDIQDVLAIQKNTLDYMDKGYKEWEVQKENLLNILEKPLQVNTNKLYLIIRKNFFHKPLRIIKGFINVI